MWLQNGQFTIPGAASRNIHLWQFDWVSKHVYPNPNDCDCVSWINCQNCAFTGETWIFYVNAFLHLIVNFLYRRWAIISKDQKYDTSNSKITFHYSSLEAMVSILRQSKCSCSLSSLCLPFKITHKIINYVLALQIGEAHVVRNKFVGTLYFVTRS